MKNFFIKIFFSLLVTSTFFMVSGFCFAELLPKEVLLTDVYASSDISSMEDSCVLDSQAGDMDMGEAINQNVPVNHSLLPCCLGNFNHSEKTVSANNNLYLFSLLAVNLSAFDLLLESLDSNHFFYNHLIIPPPEIAAIRATVIRI